MSPRTNVAPEWSSRGPSILFENMGSRIRGNEGCPPLRRLLGFQHRHRAGEGVPARAVADAVEAVEVQLAVHDDVKRLVRLAGGGCGKMRRADGAGALLQPR